MRTKIQIKDARQGGYYQIERGDIVRVMEGYTEGGEHRVATSTGAIVPVPDHYAFYSMPGEIESAVAALNDESVDFGAGLAVDDGVGLASKARALVMLADAAKLGEHGVASVSTLLASVKSKTRAAAEPVESAEPPADPFAAVPPMTGAGQVGGVGEPVEPDDLGGGDEVAFDSNAADVVARRNDALDKLDALEGALEPGDEIAVGKVDAKGFDIDFVRNTIEQPSDAAAFFMFADAVDVAHADNFGDEGAEEDPSNGAIAQAQKPEATVIKAISFATSGRWLAWYEKGEIAVHGPDGRPLVMSAIEKQRGIVGVEIGEDTLHASAKPAPGSKAPTHDLKPKPVGPLTSPTPDDLKALDAAEKASQPTESGDEVSTESGDEVSIEQVTIPAVDDTLARKAREIFVGCSGPGDLFDLLGFLALKVDGKIALVRSTWNRDTLATVKAHAKTPARVKGDVDQQVGYLNDVHVALGETPDRKKALLSAMLLKKRVKSRPAVAACVRAALLGLPFPTGKEASDVDFEGADTSSPGETATPTPPAPGQDNPAPVEQVDERPAYVVAAETIATCAYGLDEVAATLAGYLLVSVKSARERVDAVGDSRIFDAAIGAERARGDDARGSLVALLNRAKATFEKSIEATPKIAAKVVPSKADRVDQVKGDAVGNVIGFPGQTNDDAPDATSQIASGDGDLAAKARRLSERVNDALDVLDERIPAVDGVSGDDPELCDSAAERPAPAMSDAANLLGETARRLNGRAAASEKSIAMAKASGDPKARLAAAIAVDSGDDAYDVLTAIEAFDDVFGAGLGAGLAAARALGITVEITFKT